MTEVEREIRSEVAKAIERLGGTPAWLEDATPHDIYRVAEQCGADRFLLPTIGSWDDTLPHEEVLADLRRLNGGHPLFEAVHATRDDHKPKGRLGAIFARLLQRLGDDGR